jgi:hypothetical protein
MTYGHVSRHRHDPAIGRTDVAIAICGNHRPPLDDTGLYGTGGFTVPVLG